MLSGVETEEEGRVKGLNVVDGDAVTEVVIRTVVRPFAVVPPVGEVFVGLDAWDCLVVEVFDVLDWVE